MDDKSQKLGELKEKLYKKFLEIFPGLNESKFSFAYVRNDTRKRKRPDGRKRPSVECHIDTELCKFYNLDLDNVERKAEEIVKAAFGENIHVNVYLFDEKEN